MSFIVRKKITSINDLTTKSIERIAMPQPKKAIYGIAGEEFLKNADVDGFLVGRVSHDPRILMTMFRLVEDHVHKEVLNK